VIFWSGLILTIPISCLYEKKSKYGRVLFKTDKEHILFAGDASYKHQQLLDNRFGGANIDFVQSQKTYHNILQYAEKNPVIYLPSHDENSANRLVNRECLIK